jgi:tRNA(Arg) A34 adenosine deaminase TadA
MLYSQIHLTLPPWIGQIVDPTVIYPDDAAKMTLAIELSRLNTEHQTGGPFGAALFNQEHRLISVGVNRVVDQKCSVAHAEMMAFMLAQQRTQRFRLNEDGTRFTLATSSQPCCQCFGASIWAGIDEMLIGASADDVHELTAFDEGPLPANWIDELSRRGIIVRSNIQREAARQVLAQYNAQQGSQY